ncbi:DNA polymerase IV [Motilimonas pumila]|uniref:DNA polymerase IV n=1 Tax=Motilimonas pumila TaxID=2303987 RepID=A0A418YJU8_9GAMM|nr:DNA polymerase IV [Motilimonas pumila]RJG51249.1 DNA polymerase IV [Motilimonas pumila]
MTRKIIHIDMDCFYAAVEMRDNPSLKNIPIAIGGAVSRRGVIATCNYLARQFGVKSAMPTHQALKVCPELTLVPGRMALYKEISTQIHQILLRYSNIIEPLSLDEAYLDVTDSKLFSGSATYIAQDIRRAIEQEIGLTASAGVAPVKFLAKIASDENKPNGLCVIHPGEVEAFVASMPLGKVPGVGKVTEQKLADDGLFTGRDILAYPKEQLLSQYGKMGRVLLERAQGIDNRPVVTERVRKSVGVERTLVKNITSVEQCEQVLAHLYQELNRRVERAQAQDRIRSLGIKVKFADFQLRSAEQQTAYLDASLTTPLLLQILQRHQGKEIRLLGLSAHLEEQAQARPQQLTLLDALH